MMRRRDFGVTTPTSNACLQMVRSHDSQQDVGFQIEICFEHRSISRQRYRLKLGSEDEWDHIDPEIQQVGIY